MLAMLGLSSKLDALVRFLGELEMSRGRRHALPARPMMSYTAGMEETKQKVQRKQKRSQAYVNLMAVPCCTHRHCYF
jgi:hypothetical protein